MSDVNNSYLIDTGIAFLSDRIHATDITGMVRSRFVCFIYVEISINKYVYKITPITIVPFQVLHLKERTFSHDR